MYIGYIDKYEFNISTDEQKKKSSVNMQIFIKSS